MAGSVEYRLKKARRLVNKGKELEARQVYERIIEQFPANVVARNALKSLGNGASRKRENQSAFLTGEIKRLKDFQVAGLVDEMEALAKILLEEYPDDFKLNEQLGEVYFQLSDYANAEAYFKRAIEIDKYAAYPHNRLSTVYQAAGRIGEALAVYENALTLLPSEPSIHSNISRIKKYEEGDEQLNRMIHLLKTKKMGWRSKAQLRFAIFRAYHSMGNTKKAFTHLKLANQVVKNEYGYNLDVDEKLFTDLKTQFSADNVVPIKPSSPASVTPVFVVGMPRSGTTLIEQIIASHSKVHGAGELRFLDQGVIDIFGGVYSFRAEKFGAMRAFYLERIDQLMAAAKNSRQTSFIVDKMPLNFRWVGYIRNAFPEAKIVHAQRSGAATCWSNYMRLYSGPGNRFAYNLDDVSGFYGHYRDLMAFWDKIYPGEIHAVNYETLTEDPETVSRSLLDFIGLDWEPACLNFHEREAVANTASAMQVRKPIYKGSSQGWRRYEGDLAGVFSGLDET